MNSHVQIPKSILKNFAYKSKKDGLVVDYLDLVDNTIKTEKIRILDTKKDYYSEEFDKTMGKIFETPFGDISKKIRDFAMKKNSNISFSEKETKAVLYFCNNIFLRGEYALNKANEFSYTSIIQPISQEELIGSTRANLFRGNWLNIIVNKTKTGFIIPRNCIYVKKSETPNKLYYIFPLSPWVAMILMPEEEAISMETEKGSREYFYIDDESLVKILNNIALKIETGTNNKFIVGDKVELQRLKEQL